MKAKDKANQPELARSEQPNSFTPGITKGMVRQHAYELYRDKLAHGESLTLGDWVLAEKDLVRSMEADNVPMR